ncbi:MAG: hypothetical protein KF724_02285 [Phycisphaeraceae bacterium]|nr:hypothetical protein [Phycisphaeraceae bacterium]
MILRSRRFVGAAALGALLAMVAGAMAGVTPALGDTAPAQDGPLNPTQSPSAPAPTRSLSLSATQDSAEAPADANAPAPMIVLRESMVLDPPSPTASPTFGMVVAFAGDEALVTGPILARQSGFDGQIASFTWSNGSWQPRREMPGVFNLMARDATLQRLAAASNFFVTNLDRRTAVRSEVLLFTRSQDAGGWAPTATLSTPGGEPAPGFGSSIVTDGTFIICADADTRLRAGKPDQLPSSPGVHVFANDGAGKWERVSIIRRDPSRNSTWFGASLATDGRRLVIGSPRLTAGLRGESVRLADEAVVEIRRRDGAEWPLEAELKGAEVTPLMGFGATVAVEGDLVVVQANEVIGNTVGSRVFVYRRHDGAWSLDGELLPRGVIPSAALGSSLAITRGRILVSDSHSTVPGEPPLGVVHGFERVDGRWVETFRLLPQAACSERTFGSGLAVRGDRVLVGRVKSRDEACPEGGAYFFELPPARPSAPSAASTPAAPSVPSPSPAAP